MSATEHAIATERHELSFEEFDVRVSVEHDGRVWISFHESSRCVFTIEASDLSLVVAFTEKHGDVELIDRGA